MGNRTVSGQGTVLAPATPSTTFIPLTRWVNSATVVSVRAILEIQGISANCTIVPAYQVTNTPDNPPTTGTAISTWATKNAAGMYFGTMDSFSAIVTGSRAVRFGVHVTTTGTTSGLGAWVALLVQIQTP